MAEYIGNFHNVERHHSPRKNQAQQSTKCSGCPPVRAHSSHDLGSKRREHIVGLIQRERANVIV